MNRFWSKVDRRGPDDCWPWTAKRTKRGYGQFWLNRIRTAHGVAWELANGQPMPAGTYFRHTCDNPPCCNPAHVQPGTQAANLSDMVAKGRSSRGARRHSAKLTETQVLEIRADPRSCRAIAAAYGVVSAMTIHRIKAGKGWRHVR